MSPITGGGSGVYGNSFGAAATSLSASASASTPRPQQPATPDTARRRRLFAGVKSFSLFTHRGSRNASPSGAASPAGPYGVHGSFISYSHAYGGARSISLPESTHLTTLSIRLNSLPPNCRAVLPNFRFKRG